MNVFIFGAGYSARAIANALGKDADSVAGTTRSLERLDDLSARGIEPFLFDGTDLSEGLRNRLGGATHLVLSAAPGEAGDPVLVAEPDLLGLMPKLQWIGYLSTVGVYGDHGGEWVTEETVCRPVSKRSRYRVAAERQWLDSGKNADAPVAVLRLGGIYGPGRNPFVKLREGRAHRLIKPGQVFNRIHVDDIAGATVHLMRHCLGGIFNVTDDEPAPPQDVVAYAARLMGIEVPPDQPFETAELTPMARSFYGENKRVSNAKLKQAGYRFRHENYRASLSSMWKNRNWQGK